MSEIIALAEKKVLNHSFIALLCENATRTLGA